MFRHNFGRDFRQEDWRIVAINSEAAFERVMIEVMWQLCSWLETYKCRRNLEDFLRLIVRFGDVIQNYFSALCAKLSLEDYLYQQMSAKKWSEIIFNRDPELYNYLTNSQIVLSSEYLNKDFFADDLGLQRILEKAERVEGDFALSSRESLRQTTEPFGVYGIFAYGAVERPLAIAFDPNKLPSLSDNFLRDLYIEHRLRVIPGMQLGFALPVEDTEMADQQPH